MPNATEIQNGAKPREIIVRDPDTVVDRFFEYIFQGTGVVYENGRLNFDNAPELLDALKREDYEATEKIFAKAVADSEQKKKSKPKGMGR